MPTGTSFFQVNRVPPSVLRVRARDEDARCILLLATDTVMRYEARKADQTNAFTPVGH